MKNGRAALGSLPFFMAVIIRQRLLEWNQASFSTGMSLQEQQE